MINGPPWPTGEAAKTERAAILTGWGPTLRLVTLRVVAATCWVGIPAATAGAIVQRFS